MAKDKIKIKNLEEKEWIPPKTLTPDNWTTEATPEIRDAIWASLEKEKPWVKRKNL